MRIILKKQLRGMSCVNGSKMISKEKPAEEGCVVKGVPVYKEGLEPVICREKVRDPKCQEKG